MSKVNFGVDKKKEKEKEKRRVRYKMVQSDCVVTKGEQQTGLS